MENQKHSLTETQSNECPNPGIIAESPPTPPFGFPPGIPQLREVEAIFAQGGIGVATILSVTFLLYWIVRLVEATRDD